MKNRYALFLAAVLATVFFSCKKDNNTVAAIPELYTGKYLETKLRIYEVAGPNIISDTTYSSTRFNENDYATFIGGICTLSADYTYNPLSMSPRLAKSTATAETYNYAFHNTVYTLTDPQPALNPGGAYTDTLRSYDRNTWIVHSVYINPVPGSSLYMPETIVDAYYTMP